MSTQAQIAAAIEREREYQDWKWGTIAEHGHEVGAWLTIMRKELREAEDAWSSEHSDAGALEEVLQVIAVGVACMEQHGIFERSQIYRSHPLFKKANEE